MKSKRKVKLLYGRIVVYLIASAILFVLIGLLAAGYTFLTAKLPSLSFPVDYTVYHGNENNYKVKPDGELEIKKSNFKKGTYEIGQFYDNSAVYINFSSLAEYCGFYVSGDGDRLRYILPASEGSSDSLFCITDGSNAVDLNGTTIHLTSPAVMSDGSLYMPLEFVDFYIEGITIKVDEKNENIYYLLCDSDFEFYLTASPQSPSDPIDRTALN